MTAEEKQLVTGVGIVLTAASITARLEWQLQPIGGSGDILVVTMFHPTDETMQAVKGLTEGMLVKKIMTVDKFDNDSEDIKITPRDLEFINCYPANQNKNHTWIARFKMF